MPALPFGQRSQRLASGGIAPRDIPHRGEYPVSASSQSLRCRSPETRARSRDQDNFVHKCSSRALLRLSGLCFAIDLPVRTGCNSGEAHWAIPSLKDSMMASWYRPAVRYRSKTHGQIVPPGSNGFRERGLTGIGIVDPLKEAGVTVGCFYKPLIRAVNWWRKALGSVLQTWKRQVDTAVSGGPPFRALQGRCIGQLWTSAGRRVTFEPSPFPIG